MFRSEKQPKRMTLEAVEGLNPGDFIDEAGFIWRVVSVDRDSATVRRLNYFERIRVGFKQWRARKRK